MLKDALSVNEDYILKLFKNDVTPDQNFAVGSFVQADFTGYAAKTLTRALWNAAATVSSKAESSYGSLPSPGLVVPLVTRSMATGSTTARVLQPCCGAKGSV
jgi:hypothetical protein